jgi:hypothetical protein
MNDPSNTARWTMIMMIPCLAVWLFVLKVVLEGIG